jgi:hypothetical protein
VYEGGVDAIFVRCFRDSILKDKCEVEAGGKGKSEDEVGSFTQRSLLEK